jgi:condensin complex subunit 2
MSGVLTPHNQKVKGGRKKTPLSRSPRPVGLLSPNDDTLERQKSLLSRETTEELRRSFTNELDENVDSAPKKKTSKIEELTGAPAPPAKPVKKLSAEAVLNLYTNCIKLASENKINAKNTWSLALIDHISDIVKNEKDEDNQTNFQKASCTLEAGVKIYASRVDSFHSETFKMLGGMNKVSVAGEDEGDGRQGMGDGAEGSELPEDGDAAKAKKRRATVNTLEATRRNASRRSSLSKDERYV